MRGRAARAQLWQGCTFSKPGEGEYDNSNEERACKDKQRCGAIVEKEYSL